MARIVGWCAHRNEELNFEGRRIIRPAYRCVTDERAYIELDDRHEKGAVTEFAFGGGLTF